MEALEKTVIAQLMVHPYSVRGDSKRLSEPVLLQWIECSKRQHAVSLAVPISCITFWSAKAYLFYQSVVGRKSFIGALNKVLPTLPLVDLGNQRISLY